MSTVIEGIYRSGVVHDESGGEYRLSSQMDRAEGRALSHLIESDSAVRNTLEVGCAFGLSSLYICSALAGKESPRHIIVDPYQNTEWHGVGIANLRRAGYDFFELIERPSEFALPDIVEDQAGDYDLVFIDGWHTLDQTLLDLYYANRLVRQGGYIVVDDCRMPSVARAVSYVSRYPAYERLRGLDKQLRPGPGAVSPARRIGDIVRRLVPPTIAGYVMPKMVFDQYYVRLIYPSMVALRKVALDERSWDWYTAC